MLTKPEIRIILDLLREKHGPGYADDSNVAALQGKLSIMLQTVPGGSPESLIEKPGNGWYSDPRGVLHLVIDGKVQCGDVFRWTDDGGKPSIQKLSVDGHACTDCLTLAVTHHPETIEAPTDG